MAGWQQEGAAMARVRYLERADLAAEHQPLYDEIAASRGGLPPNFQALLNSPVASARMAVLGAYVRFETPLPARIKALALLTAAREAEGDYVWAMNHPQAQSAGLGEDIINAIRERRAPEGLAPADARIVQFTLELLRQHRIADATFQAVQHRLGDAGVIDLLLLIGYYHSLAHTLGALEVGPPPGVPSTRLR
jgi:4-carboxymuconolactone decarboxylase